MLKDLTMPIHIKSDHEGGALARLGTKADLLFFLTALNRIIELGNIPLLAKLMDPDFSYRFNELIDLKDELQLAEGALKACSQTKVVTLSRSCKRGEDGAEEQPRTGHRFVRKEIEAIIEGIARVVDDALNNRTRVVVC